MTTADVGSASLRVDSLTRAFLAMQEATGSSGSLYFGVLLRLRGTPPPVDTLRALVGRHLDHLPAFTHRLAQGSEPRWERVEVDLDAHIDVLPAAVVGPEPATVWLGPDPERNRPLWRMWLLPGDGETWGVGCLVHHAAQDGVALLRTLEVVFGDRSPTWKTQPRKPRPWHALGALPDLAAALTPARKVAALAQAPDAPRRLTWRSAPLSDLRTISAASGATIGQAHLAALTGALRLWSPTSDVTGATLPVCVPVDTRRDGEDQPAAGTSIGLMRVALPCGEPDPLRRLAAVTRAASRRRMAARRPALRALAEDLPPGLGTVCVTLLGSRRNVALTASSFPPVRPLAVAGTPVDEVIAIPWLPPKHTCFTILTSYQGQATLSVLTALDPARTADLADCWADALTTLRIACDNRK
ncbi:WS/DGAT domain-containing protein [Actinokineospora iranica]|uniref:Wax ester synthase-like Acyl-CoA acyltransferase domain-containing protein n=1 Tax=Actinokineospora iranica TaxID=1271860 RepID=A0A1G6S9B7_9PSEU|nr:WS/DGAT domain-containing protein [Actinokineospora iranica]SDD13261.1 Wax ester synthase-like Acyl-CoA acyltransferase domain-containing protein [Actinokineospora iranica]